MLPQVYHDIMNYFYSKTVLLCGPLKQSFSEENHHDIIVRLNDHWAQNEVCDVVYHSCGADCLFLPYKNPQASALRWIFGLEFSPRWRDLVAILGQGRTLGISCGPSPLWSFYCSLCSRVGPPLIGFVALAHLLSLPISQVTLTGMDMYNMDQSRTAHNLIKHREWLLDAAAHDCRLNITQLCLR